MAMSQMYSAELSDLEASLLIRDKNKAGLDSIQSLYRCGEWRNLYFNDITLRINSIRTLITNSPVIAVLEEYCKMIGSSVEKTFPSWYEKFGRDNNSIKVFATKGCEKLYKALETFPASSFLKGGLNGILFGRMAYLRIVYHDKKLGTSSATGLYRHPILNGGKRVEINEISVDEFLKEIAKDYPEVKIETEEVEQEIYCCEGCDELEEEVSKISNNKNLLNGYSMLSTPVDWYYLDKCLHTILDLSDIGINLAKVKKKELTVPEFIALIKKDYPDATDVKSCRDTYYIIEGSIDLANLVREIGSTTLRNGWGLDENGSLALHKNTFRYNSHNKRLEKENYEYYRDFKDDYIITNFKELKRIILEDYCVKVGIGEQSDTSADSDNKLQDIINLPNTTTNEKSLFLVPQKLQTSKDISLIKLNF